MSPLLFSRPNISILLATLLFILLSSSSSSPEPRQPRILGGFECPTKDYPFVVSIFWRPSGKLCTGTLIFPEWVMTLATCFFSDRTTEKWSFIEIHAGSSRSREIVNGSDEQLQVRHISNVYLYDNSTPPSAKDVAENIALIHLDEAFNLNDHLAVATLPQEPSGSVQFCSTAIGMGWGGAEVVDSHVQNNMWLRCLEFPMVSTSVCEQIRRLGIVADKILCAKFNGKGKGSCHGDLGGPIVCKDQPTIVIGIIRTADSCEGGRTVFTRVDSYLEWIRSITEGKKIDEQSREEDGQQNQNKKGSTGHVHVAHVLLVVLLLINAIFF